MPIARRTALSSAAAALAAPALVQAQTNRTLRFLPASDLVSLDPVWSGGNVPREHGNTVYDQLFGLDARYRPHPQMVAGIRVENDGRQWDLTLRDGLLFHDNTPVLARDCIASVRRWAKRNPYGASLMERTDEIAAVSDKVIRFRLKKPFASLPEALAQQNCAIMPERVAATDPFKQISDPTGSGPFRFLTDEHISGSHWSYAKFDKYVPRADGEPSFLAGPRIAHFDRLIWSWLPDPATAAAALAKGEHDWWVNVSFDVAGMLKRNRDLKVEVKDRTGLIGIGRFNHLHKPFNNPAIRRLVLACVNQRSFMEAVAGAEPDLFVTGAGLFSPDTPMYTKAGIEALTARTDFEGVKKELAAAGYNGEKTVLLGASNVPTHHAMVQVMDDLLRRMGFNVDLHSVEFGTVGQRIVSREPIEKGGWNMYCANSTNLNNVFLPGNAYIRGGTSGANGWPDVPRLEELREDWLNATSVADQKQIAAGIQVQFFKDVTHVPLGEFFSPACYRKDIAGIHPGWPVMTGVHRI